MTEVETLPLQREEDALLSIQNALALFTVIKRSPSHSSISTAPTVSASSSPSRSLRSNQGSCDDSSDEGDSSAQTVGGIFNMDQAVIDSIAETLSSQDAPEYERPERALESISIGSINMEQAVTNPMADILSSQDVPEHERPERALEFVSFGGINMEQAVINSIAETLSSQDAPEYERPEMVLAIISTSHISDLSNAAEDEAGPRGSLLSQMFFTCTGGSVFSTFIEPQSTGPNQDAMKYCTLGEPPAIALATSLSNSAVRTRRACSKGRWPRRSYSRRSDSDDASNRTDKTEKHRNTSKEKKLEKMASRRQSHTLKTS